MPFFSRETWGVRRIAVACAIVGLIAGSAATPARAGDDGEAPIWKGIGGLVGLGTIAGEDKEPSIQYRERGRLVLPPKMTLPPPVAAAKPAAWPVDPDVEKARKEKEAVRIMMLTQSDIQAQRDGNRLSPDQLRADHSVPGQKAAADHRCSAQTNTRGCDWIPFRNVFENIGLAKPSDVVAGQEPDRDWLTDPPKGYRVPTNNTVATFDAKKNTNQSDPRSLLYKAPGEE